MRAVDSAVAIALHSMDGTYRAYMRDRRLQGLVLGALGLVAVLVAALGVYGVMSLTVAERRREIAVTSVLASIFFGLRAFDPRVFAATAALLAGVAIGSSWWPARAAGRVDPMAALKN